MVLKKELQQLAYAIKSTQEYAGMTKFRNSITQDGELSPLMARFERELTALLSQDIPEAQAASRQKKLYSDYSGFLEKQIVKDYIKAAEACQNMIGENMDYLNSLLNK